MKTRKIFTETNEEQQKKIFDSEIKDTSLQSQLNDSKYVNNKQQNKNDKVRRSNNSTTK